MATPIPPQTIGKRSRNLTPSRHSSISTTSPPSSSSSPESKIARSLGKGAEGNKQQQRPILCTLPPTCNRQPTTLINSKDLERHYATCHAHVCESPGCGCVFPEAKLLELHQTECHDPVAAVRKERGERIFGCMVPTCDRFFQSPKARRLHMIEAHKYPKEFFFSVTNKGIGGLLKKWGEGASMVRGEWKPRDGKKKKTKGEGDNMAVDDNEEEEKDNSSEEEMEADMEESEKTPRPTIKPLHPVSPPRDANVKSSASTAVDALANSMSSLSLVPSSIRFGRGGRGGGLGVRGRGRGGRGGIVPPQQYTGSGGGGGGGHQKSASMSDSTMSTTPSGGGRGRGSKRAGNRGHRFTTSVGGAVGMQVTEMGGDVVLIPPAAGQENRGKRGGMTGTL